MTMGPREHGICRGIEEVLKQKNGGILYISGGKALFATQHKASYIDQGGGV